MKNSKFLYEVLLEHKLSIFFTTILLLMSSILEGIGILALLPLLGLILNNSSENLSEINQKLIDIISFFGIEISLIPLLLIIVVIMFLKITIHFLANVQIGFAQMRIMKDLRMRILNTSLNANWSYFTTVSSGRLLNIINKEAISSSKSYHCVCNIISILLQLFVYFFTALVVSVVGTVVVLLASTFMFLVLNNIIRKTRQTAKKQTETMNEFSKKLIDLLLAIKPMLAMGNIKSIGNILLNEIKKLMRNSMKILFLKKTLEASQEIIKIISLALMLYFVIYKANISFEMLLVMAVIFIRGLGVVGLFQKELQIISAIEYPYKLVKNTINEAKLNGSKHKDLKKPFFKKSIELKDISFSYDEKTTLFRKLNFKIHKGQFICIIGQSGIGKTTLIDIIIGLLKITQGKVTIDNTNLEDLDLNLWKRNIGYVPQETFLFNDTLYNNIVLQENKLSRKVVLNALRNAGMENFLKKIKNNLDMVVGEGGRKLSGGQKQRISIARAIIRNPQLLILDEATSALDLKTEKEISKTIQKLKKKITIIAVTHRDAITKISDSAFTIRNNKLIKI